jgi:hypothetical protein
MLRHRAPAVRRDVRRDLCRCRLAVLQNAWDLYSGIMFTQSEWRIGLPAAPAQHRSGRFAASALQLATDLWVVLRTAALTPASGTGAGTEPVITLPGLARPSPPPRLRCEFSACLVRAFAALRAETPYIHGTMTHALRYRSAHRAASVHTPAACKHALAGRPAAPPSGFSSHRQFWFVASVKGPTCIEPKECAVLPLPKIALPVRLSPPGAAPRVAAQQGDMDATF